MAETEMIIALTVFVLAWIVQTIAVVEKKKNIGDIIASTLFFAGLVLFTFYSFKIADPWFIIFNSAATILAFVNLYYIPKKALALKKDVMGAEHFVEKEVVGFRRVYKHKRKKKR
jgi:lipid-A-disaccharide synthase-like uncharacterized protein